VAANVNPRGGGFPFRFDAHTEGNIVRAGLNNEFGGS
jgi:hypothetical protein